MGLIEEQQKLNNLEYRKAKQEAEKATKKAEKLQEKLNKSNEEKQTQKEYERDLKKAVENDLKNTFYRCFERDGLELGYINLSLIETRKEILRNVSESATEWDYINDNYEKILNKVKKIYENDQKAKNALLQIQLQEQLKQDAEEQKRQQEKEHKQAILLNILYKICSFIFSPISLVLFLIILFVWGYFAFAVPVLG